MTRSALRFDRCFALTLALLASLPAAAAPSLSARAKAYAQEMKLPYREVEIDLPGRKLKRIFVPVTDKSHDRFTEVFTESGVILRQGPADLEHMPLVFAPNDVQAQGGGSNMPPNLGGRYVAMGLDPEDKAYLKANLYTPTHPAQPRHGGCMWWLVHGRVRGNKPLAHELGFKQAKAASAFVKKAIHVGNEAVVVGVAMSAAPVNIQQARQQLAANEDAIRLQEANLDGWGKLERDPNPVVEQQLAPYRVQIMNLQAQIAAHFANPQWQAHLPGWRQQLAHQEAQLEQMRKNIGAPYDNRLVQIDQQIAAAQAQLNQQDAQHAANVAPLREQLANLREEKAELSKKPAQGPGDNPAYEQRLAELDQAIAGHQGQIRPLRIYPHAKDSIAKHEAQIADLEQEKAQIVERGPEGYDPGREQRLAQLDQEIVNAEARLQQADAQPQQAREQLAARQGERAELVALGPAHFNPLYDQRLVQLDQAIYNAKAQMQYQGPQYAAHVEHHRLQLVVLEQQKARVIAMGPANYNPVYENRLAQFDQQITGLQTQINQFGSNPAYAARMQQLQPQLAAFEQQRAELIQKGPGKFDPYEPHMEQARAQIAAFKANSAPLRAVVAQYDAMQRGKDGIAEAFAGLSEEALMGAPPGNGTIEAVKK